MTLQPYLDLLDAAEQVAHRESLDTRIPAAAALLDQARDSIVRDYPRNRQRLRAVCSALAQVPASPDPWALLQMERDEVRVTRVLAWLLDPASDHGLGDWVLRWLLLRHTADARRVAKRPEPLRASVAAEVSFLTGRPDIVLFAEGLLLVGEVKVDDEVHSVPKAGGEAQTTVYRLEVGDPEVMNRLSHVLDVPLSSLEAATRLFWFVAPTGCQGPQDPHYVEVGFGSIASAIAAAPRSRGVAAWALDGVLTALLRVASRDRDTIELLNESRIVLAHPVGHPTAHTAMHAQTLTEAWGRINLEVL
jgi:hypothetical protein